MAESYTLKLRRYDPESGEPAYWSQYDVELDPERSVLQGVLNARDDEDGSIAIRCSCRAAICGSCARAHQRQDRAGLQHADGRRPGQGRRGQPDRGRADEQHARDQGPDRGHGRGALEEDPARGAVAAARGRPARPRVHRARRGHDRRDPVDGLHPVRRLRRRLPGAGGRPRLRRPGRARPRPTGSWATRATASTRSGSRTWPRTRTASTTAPTASRASRCAPRTWRR